MDTLLVSMLGMDDPLRDNTSLGVPLGDGLSGPELAWILVGMGVFLVLAATTGYVVMSVAFVREHRRRAAADWARAMGEWRRVEEDREVLAHDRRKFDVDRRAWSRAMAGDWRRGMVDADELRAKVLGIRDLTPEDIAMNREAKFTPIEPDKFAHRPPDSWCICRVIPDHMVSEHDKVCTDPKCYEADTEHTYAEHGLSKVARHPSPPQCTDPTCPSADAPHSHPLETPEGT